MHITTKTFLILNVDSHGRFLQTALTDNLEFTLFEICNNCWKFLFCNHAPSSSYQGFLGKLMCKITVITPIAIPKKTFHVGNSFNKMYSLLNHSQNWALAFSHHFNFHPTKSSITLFFAFLVLGWPTLSRLIFLCTTNISWTIFNM